MSFIKVKLKRIPELLQGNAKSKKKRRTEM